MGVNDDEEPRILVNFLIQQDIPAPVSKSTVISESSQKVKTQFTARSGSPNGGLASGSLSARQQQQAADTKRTNSARMSEPKKISG